jgi:hypothetical protein
MMQRMAMGVGLDDGNIKVANSTEYEIFLMVAADANSVVELKSDSGLKASLSGGELHNLKERAFSKSVPTQKYSVKAKSTSEVSVPVGKGVYFTAARFSKSLGVYLVFYENRYFTKGTTVSLTEKHLASSVGFIKSL